MPIPLVCPSCEASMNAPDGAAGKRLVCPKCRVPIRVPASVPEEVEEPEAVESEEEAEAEPRPKKRQREETGPAVVNLFWLNLAAWVYLVMVFIKDVVPFVLALFERLTHR